MAWRPFEAFASCHGPFLQLVAGLAFACCPAVVAANASDKRPFSAVLLYPACPGCLGVAGLVVLVPAAAAAVAASEHTCWPAFDSYPEASEQCAVA